MTKEKILDEIEKDEMEIEKMELDYGKCFGEWGIIYNQKRSASAYVLEDCVLICIESTIFNDCFTKFVFKAEKKRREFLENNFNFLKLYDNKSRHYKRIIAEVIILF